jgi:hypothetical protein
VKQNKEQCKRSVAAGQAYCWQHAHGLRAKLRSLPRNHALLFALAVLSVAATAGFGLWDVFVKPPAPHVVHVQSSGDNSPNVVDNNGSVTIQNSQADSSDHKSKKPASGKPQ